MVRPERFELPTLWFVAKYSIQLSYGRTQCGFKRNHRQIIRVSEWAQSVWPPRRGQGAWPGINWPELVLAQAVPEAVVES